MAPPPSTQAWLLPLCSSKLLELSFVMLKLKKAATIKKRVEADVEERDVAPLLADSKLTLESFLPRLHNLKLKAFPVHGTSLKLGNPWSTPLCSNRSNSSEVSGGLKAKDKNAGQSEGDETAKKTALDVICFGVKGRKKLSEGSINFAETAKFAVIADTWWDVKGPYRPLHMLNPVRLSFIRSVLCRHFRRDPSSGNPLEGLTIVDVGCGGGLLCEPLARMGGRVTGIDAVERNIQIAYAHSIKDPTTACIDYHCTTAEKMVQDQQQFDVVIALEVIEHVADPRDFVKSLSALARSGGAVIISTINRSIRGYIFAIVAAEYLLKWLPRGTHNWSKFITPDEVSLLMSHAGLSLQEMAGIVFNPLTGNWSLSEDTNVNYIVFGTKPS